MNARYEDKPDKRGRIYKVDATPIPTCFDQIHQRQRPYIYIYPLAHHWRNAGYGADCVYDEECVFSGPPKLVEGLQTWENGQFDFPLMVWHRQAAEQGN